MWLKIARWLTPPSRILHFGTLYVWIFALCSLSFWLISSSNSRELTDRKSLGALSLLDWLALSTTYSESELDSALFWARNAAEMNCWPQMYGRQFFDGEEEFLA